MKLNLRENMYVRIKDGEIHKIKSINNEYIEYENGFGIPYELKEYIVKASYNIIDLISRFDLVNGHLVICKMYEDEKDIPTMIKCVGDYYFKEEDIKSIVTHEQMEKMAYKVEE